MSSSSLIGPADGLPRAAARHDRHRQHDRLSATASISPSPATGIGIVWWRSAVRLGEILSTEPPPRSAMSFRPKLRDLLPTRQEWKESAMPITRARCVGFIIGIIPDRRILFPLPVLPLEKNGLRHPEEFRQGRGRPASPGREPAAPA